MSRVLVGTLALLAAAGCAGGDDAKPSPASASGADEWAVRKPGEKARPDDKDGPRTTTAGTWFLLVAGQGHEQVFAVVDIGEKDGQPTVTLKNAPDGVKVSPGAIDAGSASFGVEAQGIRFAFDGRLVDGEVRGNVLFMGAECSPARLSATQPPPPRSPRDPRIPLPHLDEFAAALKTRDPAKLREFAHSHPHSPLALDAFEQVFSLAREHQLDAAALEKVVADYEQAAGEWGERIQSKARVRSALLVTEEGTDPRLALKLYDKADAGLGEHPPSSYPEFIRAGREIAQRLLQIAEARQALAGDDAEAARQAEQSLREILEADEFNVVAIHLLAQHAEKHGRVDEALAGYAKLAAIPNLEPALQQAWSRSGEEHPSPEETVAKLWKEKHGGPDGLSRHLDDVYREWLAAYGSEKSSARAEDGGNAVALIELFTGATCPPCVAADLAVGAAQAAFGPSVIALRYHQHIPSDDQLANDDAEARFYYYKGKGTPTVCVNGRSVEGIGGGLSELPQAFGQLQSAVDTALGAKTNVTLAIEARAEDGVLHVKAGASGLPDTGSIRLRMALAEAEVPFVASNGVRLHEMIVRSMPGTPDGVAAKEGRVAYEASVKLADFRQRLVDYLAGYEEQKNIEFGVKPLALDRLYFVAFVQNDQTREVLHSAIVPVSGAIEYVRKPATEAGKPD